MVNGNLYTHGSKLITKTGFGVHGLENFQLATFQYKIIAVITAVVSERSYIIIDRQSH